MSGFERVHRRLLRRLLDRADDKAHTLDIDATQIIAEKQTAKYTYKGEVGYMPSVIASNRTESTVDTLAWYRQRGDASENRIKELKLGFGMERMPCGQFAANAGFFQIGVLAYNLFKGFTGEAMDDAWRQRQVQTLRWRLYQTAGKVVRHASALYLKISRAAVAQFERIRKRCWTLSMAGAP